MSFDSLNLPSLYSFLMYGSFSPSLHASETSSDVNLHSGYSVDVRNVEDAMLVKANFAFRLGSSCP